MTVSEEEIRAYVKSYSNVERLTPLRTKQILKAALKDTLPAPPADDECCGCSCTPCVKDLWREECEVWKAARGIDEADDVAQQQ